MMRIEPNLTRSMVALAGSILLGSFAQIALKAGGNALAPGASVLAKLTSGLLWCWFVLFVVAAALWVYALQALDLTYAYPLLGLSYLIVPGLAALLLEERIGRTQWIAILLIASGAACVAGSL